jgi:hypothetical protein
MWTFLLWLSCRRTRMLDLAWMDERLPAYPVVGSLLATCPLSTPSSRPPIVSICSSDIFDLHALCTSAGSILTPESSPAVCVPWRKRRGPQIALSSPPDRSSIMASPTSFNVPERNLGLFDVIAPPYAESDSNGRSRLNSHANTSHALLYLQSSLRAMIRRCRSPCFKRPLLLLRSSVSHHHEV